MKSFTVYTHRHTDAFRVVAGDHKPPTEIDLYRVFVYQGHDIQSAAYAAHAHADPSRKDIKSAIERFLPDFSQRSATVSRVSPAPCETAPVADNSGSTLLHDPLCGCSACFIKAMGGKGNSVVISSCCENEKRNMEGGCDNCGAPCL